MAAKNFPHKKNITPVPEVIRLRNRADFLKCRNGARSHERAFVLQLRKRVEPVPHIDKSALRIGFTVTKKIGNAVVRNRIKRRLRAALADIDLPREASGFDGVIIARIEALDIDFYTLKDHLRTALSKTARKATKQPSSNVAVFDIAKPEQAGQNVSQQAGRSSTD